MKIRSKAWALGSLGVLSISAGSADADFLTEISIPQLLAVQPTLTGTNVLVAQVESGYEEIPPGSGNFVNTGKFEVNPNVALNPKPTTYINQFGQVSTTFPNDIGIESPHANGVGTYFYGNTFGVAPGVLAVASIDSDFYLNSIIYNDTPLNAQVVNQSFGFDVEHREDRPIVEQLYDNYVVQNNVVIVSAAAFDKNGVFLLPSTAYNSISVSVYDSASDSGPTLDGRSKPDISAPGGYPSFATPHVSGVAAILLQAGNEGLGGTDAASISATQDPRTIKALLLNGALKPAGWNHTEIAPLDARYGAGVVNAYQSFLNLNAGRKDVTANTSTAALGDPHPAVNSDTLLGSRGWNLQSITSGAASDSVDHYVMNLIGGNSLTFSATLVWNRPFNMDIANHVNGAAASGINNLDLFLYNAVTGTELAASQSKVDNVEHIYFPTLAPGRYDLQVLKHGGTSAPDWVSDTETYSVAWMANILGDANFDGHVDSFDLTVLAAHWQQSANALWIDGDFNGDGKVDSFDLTLMAANWNATGLSLTTAMQAYPFMSTSAVPEPGTSLLLGIGAATLLNSRRLKRKPHRTAT